MLHLFKKKKSTVEIGDKMDDGTLYLGRYQSADGVIKDWFVDADDAKDNKGRKLWVNFNDAAACAKNSMDHGHNDWMVPPGDHDRNGEPDILGIIFNNKARLSGWFKGGFNDDRDYPGNLSPQNDYWSSSPDPNFPGCAKFRDFSSGTKGLFSKKCGGSVRLVRSVPVKNS